MNISGILTDTQIRKTLARPVVWFQKGQLSAFGKEIKTRAPWWTYEGGLEFDILFDKTFTEEEKNFLYLTKYE